MVKGRAKATPNGKIEGRRWRRRWVALVAEGGYVVGGGGRWVAVQWVVVANGSDGQIEDE